MLWIVLSGKMAEPHLYFQLIHYGKMPKAIVKALCTHSTDKRTSVVVGEVTDFRDSQNLKSIAVQYCEVKL